MRGVAIEIRGLEKRFGRSRALAGIDLEVPAGQSLALLGPNGAGKSTLLRLMAGLARPTAGSLRIGGRRAHEPSARAQVGLIGHATFLYPALTARENLQFAARLHRVADPAKRADRLLAEGDLSGVAHRPVGSFSRGMAQRLAIARGVAHDPAVLLLDEPFTGLDRRAAERLTERLRHLRSDGRTVVLVTHDVTRAAQLADAVAVLCRGRIAHRGPGGEENAAALEGAYLEAADAS